MPTISGLAAARLHAGGDPQVLRTHRRVEVQRRHRHVLAGGHPARGPQQAGAAGDGRAAAVAGGHRQLSRGPDGRTGGGQQPGRPGRRQAARCRSRACCTSSGTTSAKTRPRTSSAWRPAARSGCAAPTSSSASASRKIRKRAKWSSCTAPTTRRRAAATPRTAARSRATIHWVSAAHAVEAEVRLYDHLFTKPDPDDVPEGSDYRANLNPESLVVLTGMPAGAEPGDGVAGRPIPVRAAGVFLRRPGGFAAGAAGLQPGGDAAGHLGEDREGEEEVIISPRRTQRARRKTKSFSLVFLRALCVLRGENELRSAVRAFKSPAPSARMVIGSHRTLETRLVDDLADLAVDSVDLLSVPRNEAIGLNFPLEVRTHPRFERPLQASVRSAPLLTIPPWVRSLGKLPMEVSTQGWRLPDAAGPDGQTDRGQGPVATAGRTGRGGRFGTAGQTQAHAHQTAGPDGAVQGPSALPAATAAGKSVRRQTGQAAVRAVSLSDPRYRLFDAAPRRPAGRRDGPGQDRPGHSGAAVVVPRRHHPPGVGGLPQAAGRQLDARAAHLGRRPALRGDRRRHGDAPGRLARVQLPAQAGQLRTADARRRRGRRRARPFRRGRAGRGPAHQEPRLQNGAGGARPQPRPQLGHDRHAGRKPDR